MAGQAVASCPARMTAPLPLHPVCLVVVNPWSRLACRCDFTNPVRRFPKGDTAKSTAGCLTFSVAGGS